MSRIQVALFGVLVCPRLASGAASGGDLLLVPGATGTPGGRLVVALRSQPKTLNPMVVTDATSREVIQRMTGDLVSINRWSQETEPALAKSWAVSKDGRHYTVRLRQGLRFSDGTPCTAEDVEFSFRVYLDEKTGAPQRDLLMVGGKPIAVRRLGNDTIAFDLSQPYAAAERLFDGIAILPRHLLEKAWKDGRLAEAWSLATKPDQIAGMGAFRLKEYHAGERLVLERNPYYWKVDANRRRLPYLDEIEFRFAGSEQAQILQFSSGQADLLNRLSARDFVFLQKETAARGYRLEDLGAGLEYNFLFFNLTPGTSSKIAWFGKTEFRRAVSAAIDRDALVRLVFGGRAAPLWGHVPPGNRRWVDSNLPKPPRSLDRARKLLSAAGFRWTTDGALEDGSGRPVEFSIVTSASNPERGQMATIIQEDLRQVGMKVQVVPLEFRTLVDRVLTQRDFEACILALGNGDADPNSEMNIWLSSGGMHLWNPSQKEPATEWEREIDRLMERQMITLRPAVRKHLYDRVQEIVAEQLPMIFLTSPNVLVAARGDLGNFRPAVLDHHTLWNADRLYFVRPKGTGTK